MTPLTPACAGHDGLPTAAARAGQRLTDRITDRVGAPAAVAWVHAGALLQHAATTGYMPDLGPAPATADGIRAGLTTLATTHPALEALTDPAVVPLWDQPLSDGDVAAIAALWATHPVTDPADRPHGYLLGNAYQALSSEARKARALCQTPHFVADLLIDLAMRPAWTTWPIDQVRMIDPACGTGHILVEVLLATVQVAAGLHTTVRGDYVLTDLTASLGTAVRTVHGVDLDPYAAALARYRLLTLTAALLDVPLEQVPHDLAPRVAAADALLSHGEPLLERGQYHAVVMNPPYITPKNPSVREAVRRAYPQVCSGKYALSLPFHQLADELLVPAGFCAQLTANSFMKREFGRRFIEEYLPQYDLRAVIDTSGAYIPGHGTPTVILAHRNQPPAGDTVFTVMGAKGEPTQPTDPSRGLVWGAISDATHQWLARGWATPRHPPRPTPQPGPPRQLALFPA
ncbi:Eco57I restriction-modification methylase domain-containing protein [Wenjunlia vitaminophila]|uniref:Eco57I restriction-modification methylase domain-containing protein n=1 Tax=Wenjunlia vitaminophila TaxID=76728 RepID=UPI000AEA202C|nr:N-6 DNA methylase [Wenjunlia vitaminophila]